MIVLEYALTISRVFVIALTVALYVEAAWIIRLYRQVEKLLHNESVHLLPRHVWTVAIGLLGLATVSSLTVAMDFVRNEPVSPAIFALPFLGWAMYSLRLVRRFELARLRSLMK